MTYLHVSHFITGERMQSVLRVDTHNSSCDNGVNLTRHAECCGSVDWDIRVAHSSLTANGVNLLFP